MDESTIHLRFEEVDRLSDVGFGCSYLELGFDGSILRIYSNPEIFLNHTKIKYPEDGSIDSICSLIGGVIKSLFVIEGDSIKISFEDDTEIEIPIVTSYIDQEHSILFIPYNSKGKLPTQCW